jgi:hypothetical protein
VHGEEDSPRPDIDKNVEVKKELPHEVEMGFLNWASVTHNNYIAHIEK